MAHPSFSKKSSFVNVPLPPPPTQSQPAEPPPHYLELPDSETIYEETYEYTSTNVHHHTSIRRLPTATGRRSGRPSTISQESRLSETENRERSSFERSSIRRMLGNSFSTSERSAWFTCQIRRRYLAYFVPIFLCVILSVALLGYFLTPVIEEPNPELLITPGLRIPCAPHYLDQTKVTAKFCDTLGCLYNSTGATDTVPSCFISPTTMGYMTDRETRANEHEAVIKLRALRQGNLSFGGSSATPGFRAPVLIHQAETADIYRLKFMDAGNERYEVPFAVPKLQSSVGKQSQFAFEIISENPFSFRLMRLGHFWNTTVLDTRIGGLLLYDQYLQFVTRLPSNRVYGFGDNLHSGLRHQMGGRSFPMFARDVSPIKGFGVDAKMATANPTLTEPKNYYGVQPFFMCFDNDGSAYGVLLRNSNAMEYQFLEDNALVLRSIGGILDFYIFAGPTPEEVLQQYHQVVGRPFLPPYWALGYQIGRWGFTSSDEMERRVVNNLEAGIPVEQIFIDMDYTDKRQMFTHTEDDAKYGKLPEAIARLREQYGVRVGGIVMPAIHADSDNPDAQKVFETGVENGVYIKWPKEQMTRVVRDNPLSALHLGSSGDRTLLAKMWPRNRSAIPDFFCPATKTWWQEQWRDYQKSVSLASFWLSRAEPQAFDTNLVDLDESMLLTDGDGGIAPGEQIPDYGMHMRFALQCDPGSRLEDPPYQPGSMRAWKEHDESRHRVPLMSSESICMDAEHGDDNKIFKHYDVHNIYAMQMAAVLSVIARNISKERLLIMTKNSYPGMQQFAGRWLGDSRSNIAELRNSFKGVLEYAGLGFSYTGADICGFWEEHGVEENRRELCRRWTIAGAFYPLARAHSSMRNDDHDPYSMFGGDKGNAKYLNDVKKALRLRYELIPYLYTLFFKAHMSGTPVVHPLHFLYPTSTYAHDVKSDGSIRTLQFFWGTGLMISPLLDAMVTKPISENLEIWVPPDIFYDYFTGTVLQPDHDSKCTINLTENKIGLHGRGGSIIPTQPMGSATNTRESRKGNFTLLVFVKPNDYSVGEFFWDDGISTDSVEKEDFFHSTFKFRAPDDYFFVSLPLYYFLLKHEVIVGNGSHLLNGLYITTIKFYGLHFAECLEVLLKTEDGPWIRQNQTTCWSDEPVLELHGIFPINKKFDLAFGKDIGNEILF